MPASIKKDTIRLEEDVEEVHEDDEVDEEQGEEEEEEEAGNVALLGKGGEDDDMEEIEEVETDEKGWLDWWTSENTVVTGATAAGMHHLFLSPVPSLAKPAKAARPKKSASKSTSCGSSSGLSGRTPSSSSQHQTGRTGLDEAVAGNAPTASTPQTSTFHQLYSCPRCDKTYQLRSSLNRHVRWECGKEPRFQCVLCPYRSKHKSHVVRHVKFAH